MSKKKLNNNIFSYFSSLKIKYKILSILGVLLFFACLIIVFTNTSYSMLPVSGQSGTCEWSRDENGKLTISPKVGDTSCILKSSASTSEVPWARYTNTITSVEVKDGVKTDSNASYLFFDFINATSIDVTNLDTSNAIKMKDMFNNCQALKELDVTGFNTSNVTSMDNMFGGCESLTSLDVTHFNTSNVTSMAKMFYNCKSLSTLDVTGFNTSNVTNMSGIFMKCNALTSLDVTHFDTSKVTNMSGMFNDCSSLNNLNVTGFNTSRVKDMSSMFSLCKTLITIDVTNFNTSAVTNMNGMFCNCNLLKELDVTGFNTSNVEDMSSMFSGCNLLKTLDLNNFSTSNVTDMSSMFYGCDSLMSLNISSFDTDNVTDMSSMFSLCDSLATLDVTNFNTSSVTSMNNMFYNCLALAELDLSSFNMSSVANVKGMFTKIGANNNQGCKLVLNNTFNKTYATNSSYYFPWSYWGKITNNSLSNTLYTLSDMQTEVTNSSASTTWVPVYQVTFDANDGNITGTNPRVFRIGSRIDTTGLDGIKDSDVLKFWADNTSIMDASFTVGKSKISSKIYGAKYSSTGLTNGNVMIYAIYAEPIAQGVLGTCNWKIDANGKLTLEPSSGNSCTLQSVSEKRDIPWKDYLKSVTGIKIEEGVKADAYVSNLFSDLINAEEIDVTNLDTSSAVRMDNMFQNCESLKNIIGLTNLDTSNVISMYCMFENCSSLESLDLSRFNTTNVTDMNSMFHKCKSLKSLDVSHFNTSKVTNMIQMFHSCEALTNIIGLSNFDTGKVTTMASMFDRCKSLKDIDISHFNTTNVTNMASMFANCMSLTSLDLSILNTSKVTNMSYMFSGDSSLENINLTGFDTSKVTSMYSMFINCNSLISLDVVGFDTSKVTNMSRMFDGCYSLTSLDVTGFNTSEVTDMSFMFTSISLLTNLNVTGFDTSKVTNMSYMFSHCSALTSIDVSRFNTSNVTNMSYMFQNCRALKELDLSNFDMNAISSDSYVTGMFTALGGSNNQGCKLILNKTFNKAFAKGSLYNFPWEYYAKEENGVIVNHFYTLSEMQDVVTSSNTPTTWVPVYKATFDGNGGTTNIESKVFRVGTAIDTMGVTAIKEGYTLNNWNNNLSGAGSLTIDPNDSSGRVFGTKYNTSYLTNGNATLYAEYVPSTFTPSITMNIPSEKSIYKLGDTITYNIIVTNNDTFDISNVRVSIPNATIMEGSDYTIDGHIAIIDSIPAATSKTIKVSKTITENDLDTYTNSATITSATAEGKTMDGSPSVSKTKDIQNLIKIESIVKGNVANTDEYFKIKVIIGGATGDTYTISGQDSSITYNENTITPSTTYAVGADNYIYVKHGQMITIGTGGSDSKILSGLTYQLIEDDNSYETYINSSSTNSKDSGVLTVSSTKNINVVDLVNEKEAEVPTGIIKNVISYVLIIALTLLIILAAKRMNFISLKRK